MLRRSLLSVVLFALVSLALLLSQRAAADDTKTEVYLINGRAISSPDGGEYGTAVAEFSDAFQQATGQSLDSFANVRTYSWDSAQFLTDIQANPTAPKIVVAYSAGVEQVARADAAGVRTRLVVTLDGFYGEVLHGGERPISIAFQNAERVLNLITTGVIHGAAHTVNGTPNDPILVKGVLHGDLLKWFVLENRFLNWVLRKAIDFASSGGSIPSSGWSSGTGNGGGSGSDADSVGGSGGSGGESRPLWLRPPSASFRPQPPLSSASYFRQLIRAFLRLIYGRSAEATVHASATAAGVLADLIPSVGPLGELGQHTTPDVLGISNAIAATGVDYVEVATGNISASLFGAETINAVYEHDYHVCRRVKNFDLVGATPLRYRNAWWWSLRTVKSRDGYREVAIPITIVINGSDAVVDSRYLVENFPPGTLGTVLNYQVWGTDLPKALFLLDNILDAVAAAYTVTLANTDEPAAPSVLARSAIYRYPNIHLTLTNLGEAREVRFFGPTWKSPRHQDEGFLDVALSVPTGTTSLAIPVGALHDAVTYIEAGGSLDKVYVASGSWFVFDDSTGGGTSQAHLALGELQHPPILDAVEWFASPPRAEMTGTVTTVLSWSHIGLAYTFQQGEEPLDLTGASAIAFWAQGDGEPYRVKLESEGVTDNDYHGASFTTSREGSLVMIPFSELHQEGWGQPVLWSGRDVVRVSFVTITRPRSAVDLIIDGIAFLPGAGVSTTTAMPTSTTSTAVLSSSTTSTTLALNGCAPDCDDADPCTIDTCSVATCRHENVVGIQSARCVCERARPDVCDGQSPPLSISLAHQRACEALTKAASATKASKRERTIKRAVRMWRKAARLLDTRAAKDALSTECREALRGALQDAWARTDGLVR